MAWISFPIRPGKRNSNTPCRILLASVEPTAHCCFDGGLNSGWRAELRHPTLIFCAFSSLVFLHGIDHEVELIGVFHFHVGLGIVFVAHDPDGGRVVYVETDAEVFVRLH